MKRCISFFLLLCSVNCFAASGTVTWALGTFNVPDASCTSVLAGAQKQNDALAYYNGWTFDACSSDPVVAGTTLHLSDRYGHTDNQAVSSIAATSDTSPPPAPPASAASTPASSASSPIAVTVTISDAFGTAKPEQYKALSVLFACALSALCSIWAAKRLYHVFINPNEN